MVSLCVFLALICLPRPAAAQSSQAPVGQPAVRSVPSHPGLLALPPGNESSRVEFHPDLTNQLDRVLQDLSNRAARSNSFFKDPQESVAFFNDQENQQEIAAAVGIQSPGTTECAHILIARVPIADSKMIVKAPPQFLGEISKSEGLPVCREDIRTTMGPMQVSPRIEPGR
jgi:hypothetical protein